MVWWFVVKSKVAYSLCNMSFGNCIAKWQRGICMTVEVNGRSQKQLFGTMLTAIVIVMCSLYHWYEFLIVVFPCLIFLHLFCHPEVHKVFMQMCFGRLRIAYANLDRRIKSSNHSIHVTDISYCLNIAGTNAEMLND